MEENSTAGEKNRGTNKSPVRQRTNRASYNSWASQRDRGRNTVPHHRNGESNNRNGNVQQNRNSSEREFPPVVDSTGAGAASSVNQDIHNGYPSVSSLNNIRQLLDDIDSDSPSSGENSMSQDVALRAAEATGSNTGNNSNGNSRSTNISLTPQRGGRVRHRRRPQPNQNPGGLRPGPSSNNAGAGRNQSPSRQNRSQALPRIAFPRYFTDPPNPSSGDSPHSEDVASPISSNPFRPASLRLNTNPILRGLGTEEEPFELSPGLPDVPNSPSAFGDSGNLMSDEEIARQLQQEEWEAASNFGEDDGIPHPMRSPMFNMFHFPVQRRNDYLPPLRRRGESSGRHYGGPGAPGMRPPGRSGRGRGGPSLRPSLFRTFGYNDDSRMGEFAPIVIDLLGSYGITEDELNNFHAFLDPNAMMEGNLGDYESLLALAEQLGEVSRGMSVEDINKLPTRKHRTSPSGNAASEAGATAGPVDPQCNICLTDYENGDMKRLLPCKHDFHRDCVDKWLKTNATCPVCRSEVKQKRS